MASVGALLIALLTVVSCRFPNGFSLNGALGSAIADGGDSNSHGHGTAPHRKRNVQGNNETSGASKNKTHKVNGTLPNTSVNNGGDSNDDNGENDTHGTNHDEGINETVFGSSTCKGTSGTSALVFSSAILACLLASLLAPLLIT
ncbi:uncharacterized protein [Haliotis asinina]|uniref:uncharacterized protein n=1 Tax=Haliotis asinina TaxID=109174 RepID=UPI00353221EB